MTKAPGETVFSNFLLNFVLGGAILYIFGSLTSVLDFIAIQHGVYHPDLVSAVGFVLLAAGLGTRLEATRTLGRYYSPVVKILPGHELVKHGIYRHLRHPIYLGSMLIFLSVPLIFHSLYGLVVTALAIPFILHRIQVEERMLRKKFGNEYADYARKSKRLIPYIY